VSLSSVYVGIDVACAIRKRLPICFASANPSLLPLTIPRHLSDLIPRGVGNKEIIAIAPFREVARGVAEAIAHIAYEMKWKIERIAIDAPAAPPATGSRLAEDELGHLGLSSFRTPAVLAWADIHRKCADHLVNDGRASTLPHANKIWMLFGFELFAHLRKELGVEIIEVYPFAIVRTLLPTCQHKSTEQGYREQLEAVAVRTGWEPQNLEARLKTTVPGSRHDRLDAFMATWVASMPRKARRAFGDPQRSDDAIWVPSSDVGTE